jgi:hypothetical protein
VGSGERPRTSNGPLRKKVQQGGGVLQQPKDAAAHSGLHGRCPVQHSGEEGAHARRDDAAGGSSVQQCVAAEKNSDARGGDTARSTTSALGEMARRAWAASA